MTDMLRFGGEFINKETKTEDVDYNCLKQMLKYMFAMPSTFMLSLKICWSWLRISSRTTCSLLWNQEKGDF